MGHIKCEDEAVGIRFPAPNLVDFGAGIFLVAECLLIRSLRNKLQPRRLARGVKLANIKIGIKKSIRCLW
jgi:hypothetical protein